MDEARRVALDYAITAATLGKRGDVPVEEILFSAEKFHAFLAPDRASERSAEREPEGFAKADQTPCQATYIENVKTRLVRRPDSADA